MVNEGESGKQPSRKKKGPAWWGDLREAWAAVSPRQWLLIGACVLIVGVVVWAALAFDLDDQNEASSSQGGTASAYGACQDFVEDRLRAPSTADFPSSLGPDVTIDDEGAGRYTVYAYVDAENALGGTVREDFICTVRYDDGLYDLISLAGI